MDNIMGTLQDKRAELEAELAQMWASPVEPGAISLGKRVGKGTSMAIERLVQVAAYDELQAVLADVQRMLAKLGEGSYGSVTTALPPFRRNG
jgi:DnaK suppressor protein